MSARWRLALLGPPGAGKGTQARRLAREEHLVPLSTGELLRQAVARGTTLGRQVQGVLERGELVPDPLVVDLVLTTLDELRRKDPPPGFVLDGFPRSLAQAKALDAWAEPRGASLDAVLRLVVSRPELEERVRQRATASGRVDDGEEPVRRRLQLYSATFRPLVSYYRRRRRLVDVDGEGSEDEVAERIRQALLAVDRG